MTHPQRAHQGMIFLKLPLRTFGQLSGVCQSWKAICGESLWKQVFHATFGTAPFLSLSWKERAKFCSRIPFDSHVDPAYTIWPAAMGLQHMIRQEPPPLTKGSRWAHAVAVVGANLDAIDSLVALDQVSLSYFWDTLVHKLKPFPPPRNMDGLTPLPPSL